MLLFRNVVAVDLNFINTVFCICVGWNYMDILCNIIHFENDLNYCDYCGRGCTIPTFASIHKLYKQFRIVQRVGVDIDMRKDTTSYAIL